MGLPQSLTPSANVVPSTPITPAGPLVRTDHQEQADHDGRHPDCRTRYRGPTPHPHRMPDRHSRRGVRTAAMSLLRLSFAEGLLSQREIVAAEGPNEGRRRSGSRHRPGSLPQNGRSSNGLNSRLSSSYGSRRRIHRPNRERASQRPNHQSGSGYSIQAGPCPVRQYEHTSCSVCGTGSIPTLPSAATGARSASTASVPERWSASVEVVISRPKVARCRGAIGAAAVAQAGVGVIPLPAGDRGADCARDEEQAACPVGEAQQSLLRAELGDAAAASSAGFARRRLYSQSPECSPGPRPRQQDSSAPQRQVARSTLLGSKRPPIGSWDHRCTTRIIIELVADPRTRRR